MKIVHLFIYCFGALLLGCSPPMEGYKRTVRDGITSIPHVQEILHIFPQAPIDHFITQFGFDKSKPVLWNTQVFFGGRYEFTYQTYIVVDYSKDRILKTVGPAKFNIVRVSRIYDATPESIGAEFDGDYKFNESDWKKVVAANGDFSVIGVPIDTNHIVPRFDEYVKIVRNSLFPIE
jgi:hypothetical protein